jgi:hypothetical protein
MILRTAIATIYLLLLCADLALSEPAGPPVTIESAPQHPIIEVLDDRQSLNFDMIVRNTSKETLRISQIELSVYDSANQLALRRSLNTDAGTGSRRNTRRVQSLLRI